MTVRAQMESLLNEFDPNSVDAEVVLLDEATPALIKHCVRRVAKKYGGDTQRAFAICVASMQKGGYLEKGSMKLTAKGKAQSSQHAKEPDAGTKLKGYERLLKKAQKEGKSEKDLRAEAMKMIAATEASKKEAAKKMKLKKKLKKEEVECLTCEAADTPCPECKESGGLVYEDGWTCEVCGWSGGEKSEAKGGKLTFDSGRFEIRWSDKKKRYVVVTGDDWDYEDEEQAREMSAEIRHAKSLDDAAEILGVSESVEESKRTYAQAQADIMAGLQKDGWTLKPGLKVPQALSPDSSYKLFFKAQAIYLAKGDSDLGGARSLHLGDIRGSTYEQFKAALARWTTESVGSQPKDQEMQKLRAELMQLAKEDPAVASILRAKNQNELDRALKWLRSVRAGARSVEVIDRMQALAKGESVSDRTDEMVQMRRLSGIDKYPDRKLESGRSKLMDLRQREAAGVAGAHADWALGESMKLGEKERKQITLFLKRQGWGGEDFWFTDEIGRGGATVKLNVDSDVAAEIADELNVLGEFGTAKIVDGSSKSERQIVFGESRDLWP